MTGVGCTPASAHALAATPRARRCGDAQATWCTVPAPGARARPAAGRTRRARRALRRAPPSVARPSARTRACPRAARGSRSGVGANARTPSKPCSACSAGISGCSAMSGSSVDRRHDELVPQPLGILERSAAVVARDRARLGGEPLPPRSRAPPRSRRATRSCAPSRRRRGRAARPGTRRR